MTLKKRFYFPFRCIYRTRFTPHPLIYYHTIFSCISSHINAQNVSVHTLYFVNVFIQWNNITLWVLFRTDKIWNFSFQKKVDNKNNKSKTVINILGMNFQWSKRHVCFSLAFNLTHPLYTHTHTHTHTHTCVYIWVALFFYLLFVFVNQIFKPCWIVTF